MSRYAATVPFVSALGRRYKVVCKQCNVVIHPHAASPTDALDLANQHDRDRHGVAG